MLQVDYVYDFLYQNIFKNSDLMHPIDGVIKTTGTITDDDIHVFTPGIHSESKIFCYDQEPLIPSLAKQYIDIFTWMDKYTVEAVAHMHRNKIYVPHMPVITEEDIEFYLANPQCAKKKGVLVTSEISKDVDHCATYYKFEKLYYFFHGFAALDWYRGYYALNYNNPVVRSYTKDFISYNRIIADDRSYRIYFVSKLAELGLLDHGQVSFGVTDNDTRGWPDETSNPQTKLSEPAKLHIENHLTDINKLIIDSSSVKGSASARIPQNVDSFWHVVTETVFYYDKLHLTEKIFKPIVSKQPFMLLAAPGNLAYLRSYGFKTFDGIIDESYDKIVDNDLRIEAVIKQLQWYCSLSDQEKTDIIHAIEPIVLHNFHHFYGDFKKIITQELISNTKTLFQQIGQNDSHIDYTSLFHVLTH